MIILAIFNEKLRLIEERKFESYYELNEYLYNRQKFIVLLSIDKPIQKSIIYINAVER